MVFKLTSIFSMSTIDCKLFILKILCLLETGPKLYSIIIRNNNVCTSSAHDLAWGNIKCNEGNILSHFFLLVFMVYLPIKPVDVVNIAFLFIHFLNIVCIFLERFVANVGVGRASWSPSRKKQTPIWGMTKWIFLLRDFSEIDQIIILTSVTKKIDT